MPIPKELREQIERRLGEYCSERTIALLGRPALVAFKIRGERVTLFERRPLFLREGIWSDTPVAQFRYRAEDATWILYSADRYSRWNEYYDVDPTEDFEELLREVDEDPTGIFWG